MDLKLKMNINKKLFDGVIMSVLIVSVIALFWVGFEIKSEGVQCIEDPIEFYNGLPGGDVCSCGTYDTYVTTYILDKPILNSKP